MTSINFIKRYESGAGWGVQSGLNYESHNTGTTGSEPSKAIMTMGNLPALHMPQIIKL
jgi:hypothetical protein